MTTALNVNVEVGAVNPNTGNYNATFSVPEGSPGSVLPDGTIDLRGVEDDVQIVWTLSSGHQFWTAPNPPQGAQVPQDPGWNETANRWAFQWRAKNPGNPGQEDGRGWATASVTTSAVTVTDENAESQNPTPFSYRLWLSDGKQVDPSIINR